ncbi:MAG TPA: protease modulator HflC [Gammaproteobacteria bacterium]
MSANKMLGVFVLAAGLFLGSFSVFIVYEWERAVLFQLGEIVKSDFKPGLHFKWPIFNKVRKFDARVLTLDVEPERFLTAEKKNVIVDSFVKWRIDDVTRFYTAVGGDELQARLRLDQIIKDGMRGEFSKRTINEVVSGERGQVMKVLTGNASQQAKELGITIIDVRIKRIDLPADVNSAVYRRMEAERTRVAKDFRSRGFEASERIRADADRQREVMLAEAYRDAERVRGEGDARSAEIYASAFEKNADFYAFYRSLHAYRASFGSNDLLVIEPDSEFFKYFKGEQGGQ